MGNAQSSERASLEIKRRGLGALVVGLSASAALMAAAFIPNLQGVTVWFALVPALVVARGASVKRLFWISWAAGYVNCVIIYYWLMIVTVPGGLLLPVYLAVYWPLFFVALELAARRLRVPRLVAAIALWPLLELVRGWALTGLPWFYLAHALYRWPRLIQAADLGGVLFVSAVVASVNALLAEASVRGVAVGRRWAAVGAAIAIFAANLAYGTWRFATVEESSGPVVALVQPNVPQSLKIAQTEKDAARIFLDLRALTLSAEARPAEAIFWPETIMPGVIDTPDYTIANGLEPDQLLDELATRGLMTPAQRTQVLRLVASGGKPAGGGAQPAMDFTGAIETVCGIRLTDCMDTGSLMAATAKLAQRPLVAGCIAATVNDAGRLTGTYNRAVLFDAAGREVAYYDKVHLVPFGEFIPFRSSCPPVSRLIAAMMPVQPLVVAGPSFKILTIGRYRYGPAICFEDTFSYIGRSYRAAGADVLVNLTNDGWFGGSFELEAHLANALFRAVETRMAVVRAANTGISAVISPRGVMSSRLVVRNRDREVRGVLLARIPVCPSRPLYLVIGDWWALVLAGVLAAWALAGAAMRV